MLRRASNVETLLRKIIEKSDMMFQSIKAGQFEIFNAMLEEREGLINEFLALTEGHTSALLESIYQEERSQINQLNEQIDIAFEAFHDKTKEEFHEIKRKKNQITSGSKVAKTYTYNTEHFTNGTYFDKRK